MDASFVNCILVSKYCWMSDEARAAVEMSEIKKPCDRLVDVVSSTGPRWMHEAVLNQKAQRSSAILDSLQSGMAEATKKALAVVHTSTIALCNGLDAALEGDIGSLELMKIMAAAKNVKLGKDPSKWKVTTSAFGITIQQEVVQEYVEK